MPDRKPPPTDERADYSSMEVARMLGMAVRSVQLMVDRGDLSAWKTPGGHRRISRESVEAWIAKRGGVMPVVTVLPAETTQPDIRPSAPRVLLIEDSVHYQNLVSLLVEHQFPGLELHIADDGIVGLAMYGELQPDLLIVDIMLPGIDGATLIASLRSQPRFARSKLIVVTALEAGQLSAYAFALAGVPVVHKPRLVTDLPPLLMQMLPEGIASPG